MIVPLEFIGRGAKWSLLVALISCLFNSYLVTGVDDSAETQIASESRSPYVYLQQREFQVNPESGQYEEVTRFPDRNTTTSRRVKKLKKKQHVTTTTPAYDDELPEVGSDQAGDDSVSNQRFENAFTRYNFADNNGDGKADTVERADANPGSIQDILRQRQGQYVTTTTTPGYGTVDSTGQSPSYDNVHFQSPLVSYEVPSNYIPSEHFDWPSTYTSVPYGPPHHPGPAGLVAPFISGVGHLTGSVKHIQAQIGEQKAKTAYQVAEVVKGAGHAVNNAILSKGHAAGQVIGQTIHTAGEALKSKGYTAQKIIHNKGQLATSAIQSVGNIGSSLLRSKGELIGSVLKTGAQIGTTALGTASNALAGGTYLVKAKGDAASNLIAKGGRLASGVIGTKGRLISSVINAKGQFVAQIVEAKGRAAATLLETSGQKLSQLAEAIKSATSQKKPGPGWGWGSTPSESYSTPPNQDHVPEKVPEAQLQNVDEPVISNHQHAHQYQQQYQQDYADSYYDPRDTYQRSGSNTDRRNSEESRGRRHSVRDQESSREQLGHDDDDQEDFQNEYSSYYLPHHYTPSPSEHQQYRRYSWEQ